MHRVKNIEGESVSINELKMRGFKTIYFTPLKPCSIFPIIHKYLTEDIINQASNIINDKFPVDEIKFYEMPILSSNSTSKFLGDHLYAETLEELKEKLILNLKEQVFSFINFVEEHSDYLNSMSYFKSKFHSIYYRKRKKSLLEQNKKTISNAKNFIDNFSSHLIFRNMSRRTFFNLPKDIDCFLNSQYLYYLNLSGKNKNINAKKTNISHINIEYSFNKSKNENSKMLINTSISLFSEKDHHCFIFYKDESCSSFVVKSRNDNLSYPFFSKSEIHEKIQNIISQLSLNV